MILAKSYVIGVIYQRLWMEFDSNMGSFSLFFLGGGGYDHGVGI